MNTNQKKNGLSLGWPPFTEFKKDMLELLEIAQSPVKEKLSIVENSLLSYIEHTNKEFKTVKNTLSSHTKEINFLKTHISGIEKHFTSHTKESNSLKTHISGIEKHLSNHVTDTNKKITKLTTEVNQINKKLDTQVNKQLSTQSSQIKQLNTQYTQINKKLDKLLTR